MSPVTIRVIAPALAALLTLGACADDYVATAPEGPPEAAEPVRESRPHVLSSNEWYARADMPVGRDALAGAAVNGIAYAIGGYDPATELPSAAVKAFDPAAGAQGAWSARKSMPGRRAHTNGAAVIGGKIYVPGGYNGNGVATKSLYVYNPASDDWITKAEMPAASALGASAAINGKLYVVTTLAGNSVSTLYRYDPATNQWTTRTAPLLDLKGTEVGVIGGKLYAAGGADHGVQLPVLSVYDPASDTWSHAIKMPSIRKGAAAGVINGKFYLASGQSGGSVTSRTDVYDPGTGNWTQLKNMPSPRGNAGSAVVGGRLLVFGGISQAGVFKSTVMYVP